jgi:hypothetical protein
LLHWIIHCGTLAELFGLTVWLNYQVAFLFVNVVFSLYAGTANLKSWNALCWFKVNAQQLYA